MNKDQLQKELKEKIKAGIKPSDLKKSRINPSKSQDLPPSIEKKERDEGYQSDKSDKSTPLKKPEQENNPIPPIVANDNIPTPPASNSSILALKKQIELHKEIKKADEKKKQELEEKIKTLIKLAGEEKEQWKKVIEKSNTLIADKEQVIKKLQQENQVLNKTIEELKKEDKNPAKDKEFTCLTCQKSFELRLLRLVDKNNRKICRNCLLKMLNRANQETGEEIVLRKKKKEEINNSQEKTFTCQTCQQNYSGEPHQVHITNFQDQGIIPQQLTFICSFCLKDKVIIADFYCPRTSEGRDTYNPHQPQFDCYCPTNP